MAGFTGAPPIVTDGLVFALDAANYESYPGSGTTWSDLSGNGNDGTLTNGPTYSTDGKGSIVFDGTNDYVNFGATNTIIGDNQTDLTLSQFYMFEDNSRRYTLSLKRNTLSAGDSSYISFEYNYPSAGYINTLLQTPNGNFRISKSNNNIDQWYNVTATTTTNESKMYINGILVATGNGTAGGYSGNDGIFTIGTFNASSYLHKGKIGPTLIYNRALTPSEITQNYNSLKGRFGL